jgi:hypothetical protein
MLIAGSSATTSFNLPSLSNLLLLTCRGGAK